MVSVMSVLQEFIVEGMLQTTPRHRDRSVSRRLHRAILDAVAKGDPDGAERAMREHMRVTRERLESVITSYSIHYTKLYENRRRSASGA